MNKVSIFNYVPLKIGDLVRHLNNSGLYGYVMDIQHENSYGYSNIIKWFNAQYPHKHKEIELVLVQSVNNE